VAAYLDERPEKAQERTGHTGRGRGPGRYAEAHFFWMKYEDESFTGVLHVSDQALCRQLHASIVQNIGKTIKQIGNLDIGFLVTLQAS
jgi:hypothetical protein